MFFEKPIKEVEESDIERLMELEIPEDKNLEYKGDFSTDNIDHKRKLLKTVSAFNIITYICPTYAVNQTQTTYNNILTSLKLS